MSPAAKSRHYYIWSRDPSIGGKIGQYGDRTEIRVYLKDSVMKGYSQARLSDPSQPFRVLGLEAHCSVLAEYVKPHGRLLGNGSLVVWGRCADWKSVLMATFERLRNEETTNAQAVLFEACGPLAEEPFKQMVLDAGLRLGIKRLVILSN